MTVKSTVSFTDKHHAFAQNKVREGAFASVSSIVAVGIEQLMKDEEEREAALTAMQSIIRERMALPLDQWQAIEDTSELFVGARDDLSKR